MIVELYKKTTYKLPEIEGAFSGFVDTGGPIPEITSPEQLKSYLLEKIQRMTADEISFLTRRTGDQPATDIKWAVAVDAHNGVACRRKDGRLGWRKANFDEDPCFEDDFFFTAAEALETSVSPESFFLSKIELDQRIKPFPITLNHAEGSVQLNIGAWLMHQQIGQCDIEEIVAGYDMAVQDLVNSYKQAGCPSVAGISPQSQLEVEIDVDALREHLELRRPELMDFSAGQPTP
jgi:hypothetical protein